MSNESKNSKNNGEREIALVLGTAGHIDHGKTTLIAALTGVDCDRLIEEKRRGITIELGFAPLKLPAQGKNPERVVSVIDVPGHEKFIRQMVAGASGIDAALLVVAADEGVMPQTREHLAIMELLGVHDGLVAITKIDRVEPEFVDLVREDIEQFTRGTFLEGKAVIPVSATDPDNTKNNLDALRREIAALVDRVKPRARGGALFLPIDRAFPISGFGTVITGTAYHGTAKLGDEIEVLPGLAARAGAGSMGTGQNATGQGLPGKLRSIQVHGNPVDMAFAGQRVAANLAGVAVEQIQRGDVVCHKGVYAPTICFDAVINLLPGSSSNATSRNKSVTTQVMEPLKHWQRVHLCIGTSEVLARVALLDRKQIMPPVAKPGMELEQELESGGIPAQLVLEEPVVCTSGQRFILRFYSPLVTIGGGQVIYPYSHKPRNARGREYLKSRIENLQVATTPEDRLACLITGPDFGMMDVNEAAQAIQERPEQVAKIAARLVRDGRIAVLSPSATGQASQESGKPVTGELYLSPACLDSLENTLMTAVRTYQESYPAESGLPLDAALRAILQSNIINSNVKFDARLLRSLITLLVQKNSLVLETLEAAGGVLHTPDFVSRADDVFLANSQALGDFCRTRGWQLPTLDEVRNALSLPVPVFNALIQSLRNSRELALLPGNFVLTADLERAMLDILRKISQDAPSGGVTLAAVRDATGSTRKFILPVLEYFDSKGYTRRVGDVRVVRS